MKCMHVPKHYITAAVYIITRPSVNELNQAFFQQWSHYPFVTYDLCHTLAIPIAQGNNDDVQAVAGQFLSVGKTNAGCTSCYDWER